MLKSEYSEIIKKFSEKQLIYELAILEKEKQNLYIKEKELKDEFRKRLEEEK